MAGVPATALTVGELVGYLKVDSSAWRRGLLEARAELAKAAHDSSSDLAKMADRTEKAGDRAAVSFVRLALSISNGATAAATAQSVVPIFAGLGGAMAVLPALGVAVGAGMLAAKVGMAGFGDALKNVGDPAKFAESLEKLSPAARDTAGCRTSPGGSGIGSRESPSGSGIRSPTSSTFSVPARRCGGPGR